MNSKNFITLGLTFAFSLAALPFARGLENNKTANPVANETTSPANRWSELKGCLYDKRELLFAGLPGLAALVDAQITELVAKRAVMDASNTSTKEWDFAMREMGEARTNLRSASDDITKATRDTWDQQKDKVGLAWVRTQDAYAKVKSSTTK